MFKQIRCNGAKIDKNRESMHRKTRKEPPKERKTYQDFVIQQEKRTFAPAITR